MIENYYAKFVDKDRASLIRKWRTEENLSWREIATKAAVTFQEGEIDSGNQLVGIDLCKAASEIFGEDWQEDPWN